MKRPILIHPDPRLKKMCATLPDVDDRIRKLAEDMLETMYDAPGIGLAAPQIGVLDRIIVMDCVKDARKLFRSLTGKLNFNMESYRSRSTTLLVEIRACEDHCAEKHT